MASFDDPEIFRAVLDSLQAGVYLVDRDRKILFWNAGAERLTGHIRQDMLGRSSREDFLGHTDNDNNEMSGDAAPLETALRNSKATDAQISLRHKNGHRIPVRLHAAPVRNANGKMIGAVESFQEMIPVPDWDRRHNKRCVARRWANAGGQPETDRFHWPMAGERVSGDSGRMQR
jgi:PAS domain S-box-containing protein